MLQRTWLVIVSAAFLLIVAGCDFISGAIRRSYAQDRAPFECLVGELKTLGLEPNMDRADFVTFTYRDVPFWVQVFPNNKGFSLYGSKPPLSIDLESTVFNKRLSREELDRREAAIEPLAALLAEKCGEVIWFKP